MFLVVLTLLFFENNHALVSEVNGKSFKWDRFIAPCEETTLGNFSITNIKPYGRNLTFDLTAYVDHYMKQGDIELTFERCSSIEALDTCRLFQKLRTRNGCFLISAKNQIWSPVISCMEPKFKCPVLKGTSYYGTDCALDLTFFNFVPLGRYYWRIHAKIILPTKETIMCFYFAGQIIKKN